MTIPTATQQLESMVQDDGQVVVRLVERPLAAPQPHEVVVRVEASPINPSDLGMLFAGADPATLRAASPGPGLAAALSSGALDAARARAGQSLAAGNEAAGVVVATGDSPEAAALSGRTVAVLGGAMYTTYRVLPAAQCLPLPDGTDPRDGASCFVNPLTALGMVETMRMEGHRALLHTAAASNLGQMLVKICEADGVGLVNIVRRPEQATLLRNLGAAFVCDSSAPTFTEDLNAALSATGATLAFDAIGGGRLGGQILTCMEAAASARQGGGFSRYGSTVHKQLYIYGGLDRSPTEFNRTFGMAWGIGGWLLTNFLNRVGPESAQQLRQRVVDELHTTFASHYTAEVSLLEALDPEVAASYGRMATGEKYLVRPQR
jgi:NADPH2:quinone reductase